jgi:FkbM family methyltransferase
MLRARFHRLLRALTRGYPWRSPSYELNLLLSPLLDRPDPLWLRTESYRDCPVMELNVSSRFQRKIFYFPVAYKRFWLDSPFSRHLRSVLGPGDVFVDVGANIGYYTLLAAGLVGREGRVLAFEPEPVAFESLRRSVAANDLEQVDCLEMALADHEGRDELFLARDTAHSLVEATSRDSAFAGTVPVSVTTLDRCWAARGLDARRLRLVKVDVEGDEPRALRGMLQTLTVARPPLWVEVRGPRGSRRAPNTAEACQQVLAPLGYRSHRLTRSGPVPVAIESVQGREDVLFLAL